ncbi:MAG: T9SS type A sorting domain-containing protein [Melioribacteraceae bacterium]|nr:MAG: T9SS type A sorting domain-containing protein [Melioribacteraceae bacterium]
MYKVSAAYDEDFVNIVDWFLMDWRTSLLPESYELNGYDIVVSFDAVTNKFYYGGDYNNNPNPVPISNATINYAEAAGLPIGVTTELEPKIPSSFNVSSYNNYPKLTWTKPYSDYVQNYEIYRQVGKFGFFQKITTVDGTTRSYIDYDYVVGSSIKLTYKIRAKNGTGATAYSEFTPEKFIYGDLYKDGSEILDLEYRLDQNYPNPFNPTTIISYSIRSDEFVQLKIFNAVGDEVIELVSESQDAGKYEIKFNASNLSSGIYFIRFKAGNFEDTKKMLLLK